MVIVWHAKVIGRHTVVIGLHTLFIWVARLGHLTLEVTCGNLSYYAKNNINLSYHATRLVWLVSFGANAKSLENYIRRRTQLCNTL